MGIIICGQGVIVLQESVGDNKDLMRYEDEGQRNYIPVWKDGE